MKFFYMKFESISILTCESPTGAVTQRVNRSCQQLLIVNLQDNTGLCHYVIFVRKTSVVGRNKRS